MGGSRTLIWLTLPVIIFRSRCAVVHNLQICKNKTRWCWLAMNKNWQISHFPYTILLSLAKIEISSIFSKMY